MTHPAIRAIEQQTWLEPAEDALQSGVHALFRLPGDAGGWLKDLLHGRWLGHPLHGALTDVPLGAWTVAVALDAVELVAGKQQRSALDQGADAAIAVGVVGAVGAAAAGLADWSETYGRPRRVGLVHALLNVFALAAFGASWLARRAGRRPAGRTLGFLGYGAAIASGWLGGDLVYGDAVMVNQNAGREGPREWTPVLPAAKLEENTPTRVVADGCPILLVRRGGRIAALAETCSHAGGPLAEGTLDGDAIVCPWHGSRFSLADGRVLRGPATFDQPCYATRERDGVVEVRLADGAAD